MDGLRLLKEALACGLQVRVEGDKLIVRGPRRSEPLAKELLEHKVEIMAALTTREPDLAWRVEAMVPQIPEMGAIPFLVARKVDPVPPRCCLSCGDQLSD